MMEKEIYNKEKEVRQCLNQIVDKMLTQLRMGIHEGVVVVDGEYVKIPRHYFQELADSFMGLAREERSMFRIYEHVRGAKGRKRTQRGRPRVAYVFQQICDSMLGLLFKRTLKAVKQKAIALFEGLTQYAVCFVKGSFDVFSETDAYGCLEHFYEVMAAAVDGLPTSRTIRQRYKWLVEWRQSAVETVKEQAEALRHRLWLRLVDWIVRYLAHHYPQYVLARS